MFSQPLSREWFTQSLEFYHQVLKETLSKLLEINTEARHTTYGVVKKEDNKTESKKILEVN